MPKMRHKFTHSSVWSERSFWCANILWLQAEAEIIRSDSGLWHLRVAVRSLFWGGSIHATSTDGNAVATSLKHMNLPDNPTIKKQLQAAIAWKTPLEKMSLIKNPVMLLVGTADTVVGTKSSKILASLIPGAWLVQFKGGSHHLQYEAPSAFTQIVLTFLAMDETVPAKQNP